MRVRGFRPFAAWESGARVRVDRFRDSPAFDAVFVSRREFMALVRSSDGWRVVHVDRLRARRSFVKGLDG